MRPVWRLLPSLLQIWVVLSAGKNFDSSPVLGGEGLADTTISCSEVLAKRRALPRILLGAGLIPLVSLLLAACAQGVPSVDPAHRAAGKSVLICLPDARGGG
jgi:hypothetical protein